MSHEGNHPLSLSLSPGCYDNMVSTLHPLLVHTNSVIHTHGHQRVLQYHLHMRTHRLTITVAHTFRLTLKHTFSRVKSNTYLRKETEKANRHGKTCLSSKIYEVILFGNSKYKTEVQHYQSPVQIPTRSLFLHCPQ